MNNIKRGIGGTYVRSKTPMVNMQIEKDFFQCGSCFPKKKHSAAILSYRDGSKS